MTFPTAPARCVRRWAGATAVVAATMILTSCTGDGTRPASDETREPATVKTKPSASQEPTGEPAASESPSPDDVTVVPVYYAGDGPRGPALFREFARVTGDPLLEAARLAVGGEARDPDYRTLWPQVEISSVTATDGVLLVEVPGDGFTERPDGMTERDARLAIQQLVYTLQGVQQERVPLRIQREDGARTLFGLRLDPYESAGGAFETLSQVNITAPEEGATIGGRDVLTVSGVANSFEASGPCRLLQDGAELAVVPYQLEAWAEDRLFPFQVDIPLDGISGEVVVQCETDDPSGGAEGDGPAVDTKTITVQ